MEPKDKSEESEIPVLPPITEARKEVAARALYSEMEHMDPVGAPPWDDLPPGDRHVYLTYVEVVAAAFRAPNRDESRPGMSRR